MASSSSFLVLLPLDLEVGAAETDAAVDIDAAPDAAAASKGLLVSFLRSAADLLLSPFVALDDDLPGAPLIIWVMLLLLLVASFFLGKIVARLSPREASVFLGIFILLSRDCCLRGVVVGVTVLSDDDFGRADAAAVAKEEEVALLVDLRVPVV